MELYLFARLIIFKLEKNIFINVKSPDNQILYFPTFKNQNLYRIIYHVIVHWSSNRKANGLIDVMIYLKLTQDFDKAFPTQNDHM